MTPEDLPPTIAKFIEPEPMSGCWLWLGSTNRKGYGQINRSMWAAPRGAHRVVYELLVGPIPEGLVCDHLCRNPACVSPWHIELVTAWENQQRGVGGSGIVNAAKTHCPQGHPYDEANTVRYPGKPSNRRCGICTRFFARERYRKRAAIR